MMPSEKGHNRKNYYLRHLVLIGLVSLFLIILLFNFHSNKSINVYSSLKNCQCSRKVQITSKTLSKKESTCDSFASLRQTRQKVVAYSYFGNSVKNRIFTHYLMQIAHRAEEIQKYYPGWIMRIYFDLKEDDILGQKKLCNIWCQNNHLDLCNVEKLPTLGNLKNLQPVGKLYCWEILTFEVWNIPYSGNEHISFYEWTPI